MFVFFFTKPVFLILKYTQSKEKPRVPSQNRETMHDGYPMRFECFDLKLNRSSCLIYVTAFLSLYMVAGELLEHMLHPFENLAYH